MVEVPAATAVITPAATVALAVALLDHVTLVPSGSTVGWIVTLSPTLMLSFEALRVMKPPPLPG